MSSQLVFDCPSLCCAAIHLCYCSSSSKMNRIFFLFLVLSFAKSEEGDGDNVCLLYSGKNFTGGDPLLSVRPTVKVFDTNLLFFPEENDSNSTSVSGVRIQSVKLAKANCSVILCTAKHLEGNCTQYSESSEDITDGEKEVYKNVHSVDCHCSALEEAGVALINVPVVAAVAGKLQEEEGYPQPQSRALEINDVNFGRPCAVLYSDWHFKGRGHPLQFPGSTIQIPQKIRSIFVNDDCNLHLWSVTNGKTYGANNSIGFFEKEKNSFEWACCSCDNCSRYVCENAQNTQGSVENEIGQDFSQFDKHSKKIIGIGRNYRWTRVELAKYLSIPKQPLVFLKPTTSFIREGTPIMLPTSLGAIFYELELGVVMGRRGRHIPEENALDYVAGYFLALDMTAKEFIKGKGNSSSRPWEIGKGFDSACPVGGFIPKEMIENPNDLELECRVNGEMTQKDNTGNMIFNVQQLIAYVSKYMTLEPYDVILTGTPDGFGALKKGDVVEGRLGNLTSIRFVTEEEQS